MLDRLAGACRWLGFHLLLQLGEFLCVLGRQETRREAEHLPEFHERRPQLGQSQPKPLGRRPCRDRGVGRVEMVSHQSRHPIAKRLAKPVAREDGDDLGPSLLLARNLPGTRHDRGQRLGKARPVTTVARGSGCVRAAVRAPTTAPLNGPGSVDCSRV
jgi:hypothetical protein